AGPRIELRTRTEQRQPAKPARVNAVLLVVEEDSAEGRFGAVLKQHVALVVAELGGDLTALLSGRWAPVACFHGRPGVGSWRGRLFVEHFYPKIKAQRLEGGNPLLPVTSGYARATLYMGAALTVFTVVLISPRAHGAGAEGNAPAQSAPNSSQ